MLHELHGKLGSDRYHGYTRDIHQSGRHLLEIINDILDLAKVEAGKLDLRHDAVRVDALFETCSRLMDERAAGAGVSLVIEPTQVPVRFADDTRLRQNILNLLANANKFTTGSGNVLCRPLTTPAGLGTATRWE